MNWAQTMVAGSNLPVCARQIAQFVLEIAAQLPGSESGTRVALSELVWQAAQTRDPRRLVQAWLAHSKLPPVDSPKVRL